ncbi:MAG: 4Fe-4S dicluster domain-containing protein [Lachnospiraceae bacterium]|nr:4Fe-4S dicluster domain-containing protein [Lachnospiraceae bacterium]
MFKIKKSDLPALFQEIGRKNELYLPVKEAGQVNFGVWEENAQVDLDTLKSVKSPKDIFFPQCENLYSCKRDGKKLTVEPEALKSQPFVVFGMRGCDVKGLTVLDQVFLSDPVDTFYQARRNMGTIVALACHRPDESCFCKVFGNDAAQPEADVAAWLTEEALYWQPLTEKGTDLTGQVQALLKEADAGDEAAVEQEKAVIRAIVEKLPYSSLSLEGWNGEAEQKRFDSQLWEELYKPCLACGTCTFVCPTCQCYDIKDYTAGNEVRRYRCWDSCMYSDFTMMAAANNRTSQMQRFRQRFMHKLVYFPANNNGMYSCVGCGRCVEKCPASLNIVKVIKRFAAEDAKEKSEKVGGGENE